MSTDVATRPIATLIPTYEAEFAGLLPEHKEAVRFIRQAQAALRKDAKLREAAESDPASLIFALRDAARLGLEPGTEEFYLTPRRVSGRPSVLGIVGYQGEIELIYRAGAAASVVVEAIYSKDVFEYRPGRDRRPDHRVDWFGDRGDLVGAYAFAEMHGGATSKVVVIGPKEIAVAKASSQGADSKYSPWINHTESMYLKTAVHRLAKFVPTSAEFRREVLRAAKEVAAEPAAAQVEFHAPDLPEPSVDVETGEVYDAEVVEDGDDA